MQTKIYGNSSSDGFGLYMGLITALFGLGGVGLAKLGAVAMLAGVPVFLVLVALMAVKLSKWDVMSTPAATDSKAVEVKAMTFPVAAQTDAKPVATAASWSPVAGNETSLPAAVTKPKSTIETNTQVA